MKNMEISLYEFDKKRHLLINCVDSKIKNYQLEIINNNLELPIFSIKEKIVNNIIKFDFDITKYISLSDLMKDNNASEQDVISLLKEFINILVISEDYLLENINFLIDDKYIFINKENKEIKMIYIPIKQNNDYEFNNKVKTILQKIFECYRSVCTNNELLNKLEELLNDENLDLENLNKVLMEEHRDNKDEIIQNNIIDIAEGNEEVVDKKNNSNKNIIIIALNSIILVSAIIVLITKIPNSTIISTILILAIVIYDVYELVLKNNKKENDVIKVQNNTNSKKVQKAFITNGTEEIELCKDIFLIGRLQDTVDYAINNRSIGRIHARIEKNENKFYITDLASRNGSFINGTRLAPNVKYLLENGCEIKLANTILYFNNIFK